MSESFMPKHNFSKNPQKNTDIGELNHSWKFWTAAIGSGKQLPREWCKSHDWFVFGTVLTPNTGLWRSDLQSKYCECFPLASGLSYELNVSNRDRNGLLTGEKQPLDHCCVEIGNCTAQIEPLWTVRLRWAVARATRPARLARGADDVSNVLKIGFIIRAVQHWIMINLINRELIRD